VKSNTLVAKIDKSLGVKQSLYAEVFKGKTTFVVEEDWEIPAEYLKKIGMSEPFIIHAGSYAMKEDSDFIYITFTK
jgi:hypothetical protein